MVRQVTRRQAAPAAKAVNFFRRHAGYSKGANESISSAKRRRATALARAEAEATARGWRVEWEGDPDGDPNTGVAALGAVLRGSDGEHLSSLWGITDMSRDHKRVVEAELALQALGDE